ncbi:TetR/AcrR family transcriptional regulator [Polycladidibacter hongkongensis]|uniref:TetR/AcrR family transcriptional regulator n=1 Tax=Polycladidibacter hongkongensis TaxID=1647556 RepID=UPI0008341A3D|nr:TetR/AcrR family transcriptional regulator [Pseudovibrio hongkongensis]
MARTIAKDHDDKRKQIQDAAAKFFAETGFDRASMSQLAKSCGISKAAIYHYYESKDALLFDILDSYLKALRDRITSIQRGELEPEAYLRNVLTEILQAYRGADHQHRVQIDAMSYLPEEQQALLRSYQRELVTVVSDSLMELAPAALKANPRKVKATTMSVFGMLNWFYMWNGDDREAARAEYAELVSDILTKGLAGIKA